MSLYLAFDYGQKRVGVATGNALTRSATPLCTLEQIGAARWQAIAVLIKEWAPQALVVGIPFHPDGAAHVNTKRAQSFAHELEQRSQLPVARVDERYTTTEALSAGALDADSAAAAIILNQYLENLA